MVRTSRQQKLNESFAVPATNKNAMKKGKATFDGPIDEAIEKINQNSKDCLIEYLRSAKDSGYDVVANHRAPLKSVHAPRSYIKPSENPYIRELFMSSYTSTQE